jgi:hypothetical protein
MRHGARSPSSGVASERDLQLQAEDPTLSSHQRLEQRVEELEAGPRVGLKQLPISALQERLLQNWQPEGDNLLLPGSVGESTLADRAVTTRVHAAVPHALVTRTGVLQHTSTGNYQKITLDTIVIDEGADESNFDSINGVLVCRVAGAYSLHGTVTYAINAVGSRHGAIAVNGTNTLLLSSHPTTAAAVGAVAVGSGIVRLDVDDQVELRGWQNSGGNLTYGAAAGPPHNVALSMGWLSP